MIASRLIAELHAAGIELTRDGDQLHYRTRPGVSIVPFREVIAADKAALLVCLEWTDLATARESFDREHCDAVYARLLELEGES